jgi:hypothetical protein
MVIHDMKALITDLLSLHGSLALEELQAILSHFPESSIMLALDKLEIDEMIELDKHSNYYLKNDNNNEANF